MAKYYIDFDAYCEVEAINEDEARSIFLKQLASLKLLNFPDIDIFDIQTDPSNFIEERTVDSNVTVDLIAEKEISK